MLLCRAAQPGDDSSAVACDSDCQIGVALLRAATEGSTLQLCVVFRRRMWRGMEGGVSRTTMSIQVAGVATEGGRHRFDIRCNCEDFKSNNNCKHIRYMQGTELLRWKR